MVFVVALVFVFRLGDVDALIIVVSIVLNVVYWILVVVVTFGDVCN